MTVRATVPAGAPCWIDLMSSDPEESKAFYGALFGWTAETAGPEYGGYTNFKLGGEPVAGLMHGQGEGPSDVWSAYLAVEDAAATVAAVRNHGGDVHVDAMAVGELGVMAVVGDVGGAVIGMWQPGEHRGGVVGTPGAPCHFELQTRDYERSVAFYEHVFGWKSEPVSDTPELRYTVLDVGDGEGAGIMDAGDSLPDGVPAHWTIYFAVDDAEQAMAEVARLGGSTVRPFEDTPYGRIGTVADPNGTQFMLRSDNLIRPPTDGRPNR